MVTVFKVWDNIRGVYVFPPRKSTAERIAEAGGVILTDTAEVVEPSAFDVDGRSPSPV